VPEKVKLLSTIIHTWQSGIDDKVWKQTVAVQMQAYKEQMPKKQEAPIEEVKEDS